jgi:GABA(A) receptor-associated protein
MSFINDIKLLWNNKANTSEKLNTQWIDYKIKKSLDERKKESKILLEKYPNKVPIIINKCDEDYTERINRKMLIQNDFTVSQYLYSIRSKFNIKQEETLLIFINGIIPTSSTLINYLYDNHKDNDGFLYITLLKENVFG